MKCQGTEIYLTWKQTNTSAQFIINKSRELSSTHPLSFNSNHQKFDGMPPLIGYTAFCIKSSRQCRDDIISQKTDSSRPVFLQGFVPLSPVQALQQIKQLRHICLKIGRMSLKNSMCKTEFTVSPQREMGRKNCVINNCHQEIKSILLNNDKRDP